ncbi:Metallo peptidase M43B zinc-dependent metalloprotease pappalysin-like protein [Penicillium longicatenatum]|uniref:Metallo peptidase M43B zinc-dependent metalloprotease pappalysin-like protein n=1 Tax=Penicillium longicatenatum TaxID=1561947 RepID=UPI0025490A6F|nr:Metallo peptidase M43B zinc-dependent metalloprotease pappalysin-like protein [Penicillium longicatenatum]KAJ5639486.1 Metallo peptidase M43B zinc-dependent metalloprotease pappalysin-like protein [Penicillium longicatenatum]
MRSLVSALCAFLYISCTLASFNVPVYFNVLYDQKNQTDGGITDATLSQQIQVLNHFFGPIGLGFSVAGVRRVPVPYQVLHEWAPGNDAARSIQQQRVGNAQTLNIYTVAPSSVYSGYSASYPQDYNSDPRADGILFPYDYLPGGTASEYNTGTMLVQAVGQWSGLYPTSYGGCEGGDFVDDTPAEATPATGCPEGRDTCPGAGLDPVHNMMDSTTE